MKQPSSTAALEPEHYRAICDEIGARLACILRPVNTALPQRLVQLMNRLSELDDVVPPCGGSKSEPLIEPQTVLRKVA